MNKQMPQLVDARRAASLAVHWNRQDLTGVNDVLAQVNSDAYPNAATARLLFALLELYAGLVPLLHTPAGLGLLTQMCVDLSRVDLGAAQ